jgi:hypothetical protein
MRPIRNFYHNLRRKLRGQAQSGRPERAAAKAPNPPRVDFSYTIYWTKLVRRWDVERRTEMAEAVAAVIAQPGFEANDFERRYRVAGLDDLAHAGASLAALRKVLDAFEQEDRQEAEGEGY